MGYKDPEKQREYMRAWMAARRSAFFTGKSCAWCGGVGRLELDHVDPNLKVDHKVWSWSTVRRNGEIAKCQVLCNECHKKKTTAQRQPVGHDGINVTFYHRGCRCDNCKKASRDAKKEWRHRTGSK